MSLERRLNDERATITAGYCLGNSLPDDSGATVFLQGNLGAGKTTFCCGLLQAFGHSGPVKSPTYTLVEPYDFVRRTVYHFDLYRLGDPEELEYIGIRDYFEGSAICLVEWPDRGSGFLPEPDLTVHLAPQTIGDDVCRILRVESGTPVGDRVLPIMQQHLSESFG